MYVLFWGRDNAEKQPLHHYIKNIDGPTYFFDLEDPSHLDQLNNPKMTLDPLKGLIIIDEIQRRPDLFPYPRVSSDYSDKKFLILGSASGDLLRQSIAYSRNILR